MPAIFQIEVLRDDDYDGTYENHMGTYNNEAGYVNTDEYASVPPLSIPYVDRPDVEDRYEFKMYVLEIVGFDVVTGEPVFEYRYYTSWYFTDESEILYDDGSYVIDPSGLITFDAGDDGIYDFIVGFCTGGDNDIEIPDPDDPTYDGCETAFAYGGESIATCFSNWGFARWGWTNAINGSISSIYELPIYAGAAQCDIEKGTLVGTLTITFTSATTVEVNYSMDNGYTMEETHLYIGSLALPSDNGVFTLSPGLYTEIHDGLAGVGTDTYTLTVPEGDLYVVAHAVVCGN